MFIKIIKEPLVEFFLLGGVLYIIYSLLYTGDNTQKKLKKEIYISSYEIKNKPLELVKYEKILLNEAYFLELYKEDKEIKDILLKKIDFILQNSAKVKEPSEDELLKFYKKNISQYKEIKQLSFYMFKIDDDKKLFDKLNLLEVVDIEPKKVYKDLTIDEISKKFGKYFSLKISNLFSKTWSYPIKLEDNYFIVYIFKKETFDKKRDFYDIEDIVYKDYIYQNELKQKKEAFKKIANNYIVEIR
jgi:hypothetical protein